MKRIIYALSVVLISSNISTAQAPLVKNGTKLTYHVQNNSGKEYDYIVTVNSFGPAIAFSWKMTNPINTTGKINISANALQTATAYKNYFANASDEKLTSQSTVWLSRKNFNELKTAGKTTMDMTGQPLEYVKSTVSTSASYSLKGVNKNAGIICGQYLSAGDILYTVNIFDDAKNPLIQYMNLGDFTITLTSVD